MIPSAPDPLAGVRTLIDGLDDALLALYAGRRRLVALAAAIKRDAGHASRDPAREQAVRSRARRLGRRLGVPAASCDRLVALLIDEACRQQGHEESVAPDLRQGAVDAPDRKLRAAMPRADHLSSRSWLRLLPPPRRLAPMLRVIPAAWQARWLEAALRRALAGPLATGVLADLADRRIGIEVSDLGVAWVFALRDGALHACTDGQPAEATVRGTATDLLLLASRREDADTLFFQRRLVLTGDTELGLTARNLLDQLPWQEVPLGLRIALHRGAGLASAARAAHRGEPAPQ
jgi:predicted lipid carrier protein YhbT/chorismate mutase